MTWSRVDFTVARIFSGPHAVSKALGFAGVAGALLFFLAALFTALEALSHALHIFLSDSLSTSTSHATERSESVLQSGALRLLLLWVLYAEQWC